MKIHERMETPCIVKIRPCREWRKKKLFCDYLAHLPRAGARRRRSGASGLRGMQAENENFIALSAKCCHAFFVTGGTHYTKLFNHIVTSSIWCEDDQTRVLWITMLAISDKHGEVKGSVIGLARAANIPVGACKRALEILKGPDEYSRTKTCEGRRIEEIDGGWCIINYEKHRHMASLDERREASAERQRRRRARLKAEKESVTPIVTNSHTMSHDVTLFDDSADAEAEAYNARACEIKEGVETIKGNGNSNGAANESRPTKQTSKFRKRPTDEEFMELCRNNPAYSGIDIDREFEKLKTWCAANGQMPTKRRFANWLNRAAPMKTQQTKGKSKWGF